jgi:hypothetical protein
MSRHSEGVAWPSPEGSAVVRGWGAAIPADEMLRSFGTRYRANGHNHQRPGLTIYLPGNGGLVARSP